MTEGAPLRVIIRFSVPLLIGNIFQQMYTMADSVVAGRLIGVSALAAVGSNSAVLNVILGFIQGTCSGFALILARQYGAGEKERVSRSLAVNIILGLCLGIFLSVVGLLLARPLLVLVRTPADIIAEAGAYLRVILAGILASILYNGCANIMRAVGDSRTPLYFLVISSIGNIILDFIFVLFFGMGVEGLALATVMAQFLAGLLCVAYIRKKVPALHLGRDDFKVELSFIKEHVITGIPMGCLSSIVGIGNVFVQSGINMLGTASVAAVETASRLNSFAIEPSFSFGVAMANYTAQNLGGKKYDRIRKGVRQCGIMAISVMALIAAINIAGGRWLIQLFVGDGETGVIALSYQYLVFSALFYPALAVMLVYRFALQGLGKNRGPSMSGVAEFVMSALVAFILAPRLGFSGICLCYPLAWTGSAIPVILSYRSYIKKGFNIMD